jgi:hypothetical protein
MTGDEMKDEKGKLDCRHTFHSECIGQWVLKNNYKSTCPTCRQPISLKTAMRITGCTSLVSATKAQVIGYYNSHVPNRSDVCQFTVVSASSVAFLMFVFISIHFLAQLI